MKFNLRDTETEHPLLIATSLFSISLFSVFNLLVLRAESDSVPVLVYVGFLVFALGFGTGSVLYAIEGFRRRRQ